MAPVAPSCSAAAAATVAVAANECLVDCGTVHDDAAVMAAAVGTVRNAFNLLATLGGVSMLVLPFPRRAEV